MVLSGWVGAHRVFLAELFVVLCVSSAVLLPNIGAGSLADYDEAIYAQVSSEMASSGDFLTMHFKGVPYYNKPPLMIYLVSSAFRLFGASTLSARIWPALFGVGVAAVTYLLGRELFSHSAGLMASLILATSPEFVHYGRMLMLDVPSAFFIASSVYLFVLTRKKGVGHGLLGLSLGLGVLLKAVTLAALPIILFYVFLVGDFSAFSDRRYLWTVLVLGIVAVPWHLSQYLLHGNAFLEQYVGYTMLKRFSTPLETHDYGNLYYLRVLFQGLGLWVYPVLLALPCLLLFYRRSPLAIVAMIWLVGLFVVFLAAKTKLPWYLTTLYPPLALSAAVLFDGLNVRGMRVGWVLFAVIFLASFHLPAPFYCNDALYNIAQLTGGDVRVHNSVSREPAAVFYLGVARYKDRQLTSGGSFYASSKAAYANFTGYPAVYSGGGYVLFARDSNREIQASPDSVPENQKAPRDYCYAYMPGNLGRSSG